MPYELLTHTADIRIKAFGKSTEELFSSALEGLCSILKQEIEDDASIISTDLSVNSYDKNSLIIDFLSDALSLMYQDKVIYCVSKFSELSDNKLETVLYGFKTDCFDEDIKAVTYHEAEIIVNNSGEFACTFIIDI